MPHRVKEFVIDPIIFLLVLCAGSSFFGWAALMWESKEVDRKRVIFGSVLSGAAGVIVALLLWDRLIEVNPMLLAGVSLLSGVGGTAVLDVMVAGLLRFLRERFNLEGKS